MHLSEIITQVQRVVPSADRAAIDVAINMIHRQYIQPNARMGAYTEYSVGEMDEEVYLDNIAHDIYELNYILDTTTGAGTYAIIPVIGPEDVRVSGVRVENGLVHMQNIIADASLQLHYFKKLSPLGGGTGKVTVPEIPEDWHDLYWLGAVWLLTLEQKHMVAFLDRLNAFKQDRLGKTSQPGFRIRRVW